MTKLKFILSYGFISSVLGVNLLVCCVLYYTSLKISLYGAVLCITLALLVVLNIRLYSKVRSYISKYTILKKKFDSLTKISDVLKGALDSMSCAVCIRDSSLQILYCNPEFTRLVVASSDTAASVDSMYFEIDDRSRHIAKEMFLENIKSYDSNRVIFVKGTDYIYSISDRLLKGNQQISSVAFDITKYVTNYDALEIITVLSRFLADTGHAVMLFSLSKRLIFYSYPVLDIFGISQEYLDSNPYYESLIRYVYLEQKLCRVQDFESFKDKRLSVINDNSCVQHQDVVLLNTGQRLQLDIIPQNSGGFLLFFQYKF
ncbi:hypothetical protein [Rickettsia endosymbiont of Cardiosporidium cionae]|uniref:hypothetical protein n=1 Tax=Rickettsia endosymbiont of Cardiosporidium cionae TaxID=2777155 RepID=UPI00189326C4|nr:hypothetical protein [Rickettsia endosymbiont of Cardiosporidium cionae]KAF8818444.1 hypothetical protein IHI24_000535 [Rickettsia endosymbiont of Cardiosporidium cionae]